MTSPPLYVCFAGLRKGWPFAPLIAQPADSLEAAVKLRDKDGTIERIFTPYGPILFRLQWLGCFDHIPDEDESEVLAQQLPPHEDDE